MSAERPAGTAQALLLLFGSCLPVLGAVLIAPVLPRMQAHFAETPGAAVLVPVALTLPALVIAFLAPLAGLLADRVGRRPLLLASMLLYSLCGVLPLWLDSLGLIVASRAGIGLAEAGIMTCCTTLMGDYFDGQRRERLFALQMVATSLSAALFMGLGGALGESGWRTPFALYAAGLLCLPLMAALLWEPQVRHAEPLRADAEGFPWAALAPLYLLTLLAGVSLFIVPVQAGYLLQLLHVDAPQQVGMTMGANQLGVLAGALAFRLLAALPARRLLALGFATAGLGGALMALETNFDPQFLFNRAFLFQNVRHVVQRTHRTFGFRLVDVVENHRKTVLTVVVHFTQQPTVEKLGDHRVNGIEHRGVGRRRPAQQLDFTKGFADVVFLTAELFEHFHHRVGQQGLEQVFVVDGRQIENDRTKLLDVVWVDRLIARIGFGQFLGQFPIKVFFGKRT